MPRRVYVLTAVALLIGNPAQADSLALDIAKASIAYGFPDKTTLDIQLTETGASDFAAFTQKHVGELVDLKVDGKVVMSPKLVEPITAGRITVSGQFAPGKLEAIARKIAAGAAAVNVETRD